MRSATTTCEGGRGNGRHSSRRRPVAGDIQLGEEFLERMTPWIYRRYLSNADINGIKALKRRIERRTHEDGTNRRNVKCGHGGIRDIEFVIQFLQLLNGADLPKIRTGNTLEGIARLSEVGCLTDQEGSLLSENYAFLRKVEHRLQIMFDLQTHTAPEDPEEIRKLALRMGYRDTADRPALKTFQKDYENCTEVNRRILDHLLHDAFRDDARQPPRSTWCSTPIRPSSASRRFWASIHSATSGGPIAT